MVILDDRLLRGVLAGILGEPACIVINYISQRVLHFAEHRWVEMLAYLVFGRPTKTLIDWVLAYFLCLVMGGALGFVFARFMMPRPDDGRYYFRAVALSIGFMLSSYAVGNLFKVPLITGVHPHTILTTLLSAFVWGLIIGYFMKRWDKVYAQDREPERVTAVIAEPSSTSRRRRRP